MHSGEAKIIARRRGEYCEAKGLLPEEQCGFHPRRLTMDMMFKVRRLQELGRKVRAPLFPCFIALQKAFDFFNPPIRRWDEIRDVPKIENYIVAILLVGLQRFSKDPDILTDLVHLQG